MGRRNQTSCAQVKLGHFPSVIVDATIVASRDPFVEICKICFRSIEYSVTYLPKRRVSPPYQRMATFAAQPVDNIKFLTDVSLTLTVACVPCPAV